MFRCRSRSSRWFSILALGVGLALGACDTDVFVCQDDGECANGDIAGICQPNGWCSFSDPTCLSAQRYGEYADEQIADTCVSTDALNALALDAAGADDVGRDGLEPPGPTRCPDDPYLALCLNFESVDGSTVYDDHDPLIEGELTPTAAITDGLQGNALAVLGDGGHLNLGAQIHPTHSFTVEVWVRGGGSLGQWSTLISQWTTANDAGGFWLGFTNDSKSLEFWVDDQIASTPMVSLGAWNRVTATHNAYTGQMRLYLNGEMISSATHEGPLAPTNEELVLGNASFNSPLHGQLDGVRLWHRVLEPDEIATATTPS